MKELILRELRDEDEHAFFKGLKEWNEESLSWYTFDWKLGMDFSELLKILTDHKNGVNLPENEIYDDVDKEMIKRYWISCKI